MDSSNSSQNATRKLVVGFSKPKSGFVPFSWAIRCVLGTEFSHVYIKFKSDSFSRVLIYQASGTAVNFISETRFLEKEIIVEEYELEISESAFVKTLQFAIDQVGVPYGIGQIFGILYVKAMALFGQKADNPFKRGYVCSELVAEILKEIVGYDLDANLNSIDPKQVLEILRKNHALEIR